MRAAGGLARVKPFDEVDVEADLLDWADAVLLGSPVHYGNVASALFESGTNWFLPDNPTNYQLIEEFREFLESRSSVVRLARVVRAT